MGFKIGFAAENATAPSPLPMKSSGVTACIAVRNGTRALPRALDSVRNAQLAFDEVIVVDDASDDGTPELVRARFPDVTLITLPENVGPAEARNVAFAAAGTDRILFLDSDVELDPRCPSLLVAALDDHPGAVLAMPTVLYAQEPRPLQFDGARCHFLGLMILDRVGNQPSDHTPRVRELGSVVTACVLLDAQRWGTTPPLDRLLFYSYEDHDLGVRARLRGFLVLGVSEAVCFHGEGTPGLSVRGPNASPRMRIYLNIRNRWRVMLKTYELRTFALLAPPLLLFEIAQFLGAVRKGWLTEWVRALAWSLRYLPDTLKHRRGEQNERMLPDRDLLSAGPLPIREGVAESEVERAVLHGIEELTQAYWDWVRSVL